MTDVIHIYDMAELAEASYANLLPGSDIEVQIQSGGQKFSATQAAIFVEKWEVIDHLPDTYSDFSATVFQSKINGEYTLSIRGTAGGGDLGADAGDIVSDGLAWEQIIDLFNYAQELTRHGNYSQAIKVPVTIDQALLEQGSDAVRTWSESQGYIYDNPGGNVWKVELLSVQSVGDGVLYGKPLHVTGHSLGGHLAAAFSRLFPSITTDVTMINGAGFASGSILDGDANIKNLFTSLVGTDTGFLAEKITNYVGSAAWDFVAQDWPIALEQPGVKVEVETESYSLSNTLGHGSGQMTDTLAVMAVLSRIDQSLSIDTLRMV